MKKKVLSLVVASVLTLGLCACGKEANKPSGISEEPAVSVTTPAPVDGSDLYGETSESSENPENNEEYEEPRELIYKDLLYDAFMSVFYKVIPIDENLYNLWADSTYWDDDMKNRFGYCFIDLDVDGKSEMVLGIDDVPLAFCNYGDDGLAHTLIGAGYRSDMKFLENGHIVVSGSEGAALSSVAFYEYANGKLNLLDFFFTDLGQDQNGDYTEVTFHHNKSGEWDSSASEQLTADEYTVATEIGLEEVTFTYEPIAQYAEGYGGAYVSACLEDFINSTWELEFFFDGEYYYDVETYNVLQYIQFMEDGSVVFCRNDEGNDYYTYDVNVFEDDITGHVELSFLNANDVQQDVVIIGVINDGHLLTQRRWWSGMGEDYEEHAVYEYYKFTVG